MNIFKWATSKFRTFTIVDVGCFKLCLFAFALMVAKVWPGVLGLDWYWYGLVFAVTYVWLAYRMLRK